MKSNLWKSYVIWACATFFYIYQFVLRVSPSLIVDDLMIFFQLDASSVARFSALSMYSYSLLQIPSGILADIFGVRRVILTSIVCCITGVFLFVSSQHLFLAQAGRLLLGAGSAAAFLCVSKIATQWFPPTRRASLLGFTMALGTVGAYAGNTLLSHLILSVGWRHSLLITNVFGIIVLIVSFIFIPKNSPHTDAENTDDSRQNAIREVLGHFVLICKTPMFWIYSISALGLYLCLSVIADLWGTSLVMETYHVTKQSAARSVTLIYVGLCLGSITLTFIADYIKRRQILIQLALLGLVGLTSTLFYASHLSLPALSTLFFLIGFCGGAEMLCFASICEMMNKKLAGTLTGFMNCVVMLGGALIAEQVGRLLDFFWEGGISDQGIRIYSAEDYRKALSLVIIVIAMCAVTSLFLKKTHSNKVH